MTLRRTRINRCHQRDGSKIHFISFGWSGPELTYFESVSDFTMSDRSGFYHVSPGPDFIYFECGSGSRFYQGSPGCGSGSRFYPFLSPGPDPYFIHQVRILSHFEFGSGSGFYQAYPDPGPGTNTLQRCTNKLTYSIAVIKYQPLSTRRMT